MAYDYWIMLVSAFILLVFSIFHDFYLTHTMPISIDAGFKFFLNSDNSDRLLLQSIDNARVFIGTNTTLPLKCIASIENNEQQLQMAMRKHSSMGRRKAETN